MPLGILPTLAADDLQRDALTDVPRYRALSNGRKRWRDMPSRLRMHGADPIDRTAEHITFEGANTSLQIHLRTSVADVARTHNAAQLVTPVALAIGSNAPLFCGHRLRDETRIALFKQSLDYRDAEAVRRRWPEAAACRRFASCAPCRPAPHPRT